MNRFLSFNLLRALGRRLVVFYYVDQYFCHRHSPLMMYLDV